jgi:hypothetical protein
MDAAVLSDSRLALAEDMVQFVDAAEFRRLLVSHRRMVRADRRAERLRGLLDVDTGEIFLTDERRLIDARC